MEGWTINRPAEAEDSRNRNWELLQKGWDWSKSFVSEIYKFVLSMQACCSNVTVLLDTWPEEWLQEQSWRNNWLSGLSPSSSKADAEHLNHSAGIWRPANQINNESSSCRISFPDLSKMLKTSAQHGLKLKKHHVLDNLHECHCLPNKQHVCWRR